jgi:hypothetical protein
LDYFDFYKDVTTEWGRGRVRVKKKFLVVFFVSLDVEKISTEGQDKRTKNGF